MVREKLCMNCARKCARYRGKNIANPISLILSSAMLFDWLGKKRKLDKLILASNLINKSVLELLKHKENLTRDLGGKASTTKTTDNLINILNNYLERQSYLQKKSFSLKD